MPARADGTVSRSINVAEDGYERLMDLSSDRARAIGQALIAAADEVDSGTSVSSPAPGVCQRRIAAGPTVIREA